MYTIILRKGSIELEFITDDKYAVEKQLDLIIHQAADTVLRECCDTENSNQEGCVQYFEENIVQETSADSVPADNVEIEEPFADTVEHMQVQPVVFEHINKEEQQTVVNNTNEYQAEDIIPQSIDIGPVKPVTINSLQNPEVEQQPDFDKILNNELTSGFETPPTDKDERFIQYVEGKSALDKLDFLVITAQYLAQYENMNTFNLKHINAKLMQNFTIIVDHAVLQSAITREFVTQIYHHAGDELAAEYMLTEKGLRSY